MDIQIPQVTKIYHNFIREHEVLKGDTFSMTRGIKVEPKNKGKY